MSDSKTIQRIGFDLRTECPQCQARLQWHVSGQETAHGPLADRLSRIEDMFSGTKSEATTPAPRSIDVDDLGLVRGGQGRAPTPLTLSAWIAGGAIAACIVVAICVGLGAFFSVAFGGGGR